MILNWERTLGVGFWLAAAAVDARGLRLPGAVFLAEEAVETQIMTWAARRRG